MTPQEVIQEIKHFSVDEKAFLIERIKSDLREDLERSDEKRELTTDDKIAIIEDLYGSLYAEGVSIPMTKEEVRDMRVEYLMEKYYS